MLKKSHFQPLFSVMHVFGPGGLKVNFCLFVWVAFLLYFSPAITEWSLLLK